MSQSDNRLDMARARQIQQDLDDEQVKQIALNKLLHTLGAETTDDRGHMEAAFGAINRIRDLEARLAAVEEKADRADSAAETALAIAETNADQSGGPTKKRVALLKTRNELVRKLALDRSAAGGSHVTVADVQEMAKPEVKLFQQTVEDAWDELEGNWAGFSRGTTDDGKKCLRISRQDLDADLVSAVEHALDRDDLSKRLLNSNTQEGG